MLNRLWSGRITLFRRSALCWLFILLFPPLTVIAQERVEQNCQPEVARFLQATAGISLAEKIDSLWSHFGGRPFASGTLTTSGQPEELIMRLDSFDCITWIDQAVALLQATNWEEYQQCLVLNRYFDSDISFRTRRHFFSDWLERPEWYTPAALQTQQSQKLLNRRGEDQRWIPGLPVRPCQLAWLPAAALPACAAELNDADLVGFISDRPGLDVSHVGLLQVKGEQVLLMHASSTAGAIVREDLFKYADRYPGVIIIRQRWNGGLD
ncbi:MAG: DUF1460 domain-containing protein [Candidatus Delongbacteria bacterium]|nr:DUF1460 domain-containing protein [Candidatus Delongbacteria bacterium]